MSAARIAKLQSLLSRVERNRRPRPAPARFEAGTFEERGTSPRMKSVAPAEDDEPILELQPAEAAPRRASATPMERALSGDREPVEDDDEPQLIIEKDDEPQLTVDDPADHAPTAPVAGRGLKAPAASPSALGIPASATVDASRVTSTGPRGPAPPQRPPSSPYREATGKAVRPDPIHASAPVARVVTQPEPTTFGQLLDRTLALRPTT